MQQNVIIMELCTGGSLYEVIDSPENSYGLNELEFKQVIHDVGKCLETVLVYTYIHTYIFVYTIVQNVIR